MTMKRCVLDDNKLCTDCGECNRCDLDPDKICDNCCKCLETDQPFARVPVADIVTKQTGAYLREYYSYTEEPDTEEPDREEEDYELPYSMPDEKLVAEWEERLRAYEEQEKQHLPKIRGMRKRKNSD